MTLTEATEYRDAVKASYLKALQAQEYEIENGPSRRKLKNSNVSTLRKELDHWENQVAILSGTRKKIGYLIP